MSTFTATYRLRRDEQGVPGWYDQLGFRAGRIKLPYGLYNQSRDVDMARTSVLLPQSVYSEVDRELLIAYEGVGLYGNVTILGR